MPDKDIMEMSILPAYDDNTWMEVVDTNETDPALQNKRMLAKNANRNEHVQNTDKFLDQNGTNEVSAQTLDQVANRAVVFGWIHSEVQDPNTTSFMRIGQDTGGQRVVLLNTTAYGGINIAEVFTGMDAGAYLMITFNGAGGSLLCKNNTPFATVSGWVQAVCTIVSDNLNEANLEGSLGIVNIIRN